MYALVPGTGGVTLRDSRSRDTGYPVNMRIGVITGGRLRGKSADELVPLLSMQHQEGQLAPLKTTLTPGLSLGPGHVLETVYNQYPGYNLFPYDWRQDIRHSAEQLIHFLEQHRSGSDTRWKLVGHSQGGLVILVASILYGKKHGDFSAFSRLVKTVVLVGVPVSGTVNAARALITGNLMGEKAASSFTQIVRTWPAIFQMLPRWRAVVERPKGKSRYEYSRYQLWNPETWQGFSHMYPDMFTRFHEYAQMMSNPLKGLGGNIGLLAIQANNRKTTTHIRRINGVLTAQTHNTEPGDTLVPHDTTMRSLLENPGFSGSPRYDEYVLAMGAPVNKHSMLLNDPSVSTRVKGFNE